MDEEKNTQEQNMLDNPDSPVSPETEDMVTAEAEADAEAEAGAAAKAKAEVNTEMETATEPIDEKVSQTLLSELDQIKASISDIAIDSTRLSREMHEMHRLYHNEFAGRLKSMQDELNQYHDADKGKAFDAILSAIARIYSNHESLTDEISDSKTKKHVEYLLLDLSDLLEEYGVQRQKSVVGDKRNVRHCQIAERIPSENPALHDTIAASHNTGFHKDNRTIIKELVDVYFFDKCAVTHSECSEGISDDVPSDVNVS